MTESFTLMFIWTFHRRNTGRLANVQSVNIDTAATANDNAVCISRGWQDPGVSVYQFFLAVSLVERSLTTQGVYIFTYWIGRHWKNKYMPVPPIVIKQSIMFA